MVEEDREEAPRQEEVEEVVEEDREEAPRQEEVEEVEWDVQSGTVRSYFNYNSHYQRGRWRLGRCWRRWNIWIHRTKWKCGWLWRTEFLFDT